MATSLAVVPLALSRGRAAAGMTWEASPMEWLAPNLTFLIDLRVRTHPIPTRLSLRPNFVGLFIFALCRPPPLTFGKDCYKISGCVTL